MNNDEIKIKYKEKILGVLKYCISFFDEHDIKWFIACGSAIGTIRHRGMIPWDDDIDIYMPRSDYNKLYELKDEMLVDGFRFACLKDDDYPLSFGKVIDDNTTVWQHPRFPYNVGCYVDIFPLDLTNIGMMSFGKKWQVFHNEYLLYHAKISDITIRDVIKNFKRHNYKDLYILAIKFLLLFRGKKNIHNKLLSIESTWNKEDGDRYVSFTEAGMYMFPKKWFEDFVMMPFEGMNVRISKHYNEYLTYIYGDYMTPPPPDQQKGDGPHDKLYINLDKKVPMKLVKRLVKK